MSDNEDPERIKIRSELSSMSFEDLQKLKEKLGSKVYNEAVFGTSSTKRNANSGKQTFKRENKNRPREMSSNKPVPMFGETKKATEERIRDPRFDSLCGEYNAKAFKKSYSFLSEIKEKELETLKKELHETEDEDRQEQIKYLIQRTENQIREENKHRKISEKRLKEKEEMDGRVRRGEAPQYVRKSDKKILSLVEQYEELKSSGKLEKHITKHRKKNAQKVKRKRTIM